MRSRARRVLLIHPSEAGADTVELPQTQVSNAIVEELHPGKIHEHGTFVARVATKIHHRRYGGE